jgi:hypothetical protein
MPLGSLTAKRKPAEARIIRFPPRGPFVVRVAHTDGAWLVTCREHGWLFGSRQEALADAAKIAAGFGVAVEVVKQ